MTNPRNLPDDLAEVDFENLLDQLDDLSEPPPSMSSAIKQSLAEQSPTPSPNPTRQGTSQPLYRPPTDLDVPPPRQQAATRPLFEKEDDAGERTVVGNISVELEMIREQARAKQKSSPTNPLDASPKPPPAPPAPRPWDDSDDDIGGEEERTVVGTIPKELLENARGTGRAGLRNFVDQAKPTTEIDQGDGPDGLMGVLLDEQTINAPYQNMERVPSKYDDDDEPSVVTSAPAVLRAHKKFEMEAGGGVQNFDDDEELFDPFADLRETRESVRPSFPASNEKTPRVPLAAPPRPKLASSPFSPEEQSGFDDDEIETSVKKQQKPPPPPPPSGRLSVDLEEGPKLLEPQQRLYPSDDSTTVLSADELRRAISTKSSAPPAPEHALFDPSDGGYDSGYDDESTDERDSFGSPPPVQTSDRTPTPVPTGEVEDHELFDMENDALSQSSAVERLMAMEPSRASLPTQDHHADEDDLSETIHSIRPEAPTRPLSSMPPPLPVPPEAQWPDEQDAMGHLSARGLVDSWRTRAEWIEVEARLLDERSSVARQLLVASELYAMAGDDQKATELAVEARDLQPQLPLTHRQARARELTANDFEGVANSLESESRMAPTPVARAHAFWLSAEIARLVQFDPENASKKMEQAMRIQPTDPRPHLVRLSGILSQPGTISRYHFPESEELQPLAQAVRVLEAGRDGRVLGEEEDVQPGLHHLTQARKALAAGNVAAASEALGHLRSVRSVGDGALWLAVALESPNPETRPAAIEKLEQLQNGSNPWFAQRLIIGRSLEQGESEFVKAALMNQGVFTYAEKVALGALIGAAYDDLQAPLEQLQEDHLYAPLSSAVSSYLSGGETAPTVGSEQTRGAFFLGKGLASPGNTWLERVGTLEQSSEGSALLHLLRLEQAVDAGQPKEVAQGILNWPSEGLDSQRERHLLATLIYEKSGLTDEAEEQVREVLSLDNNCEMAARIWGELRPEVYPQLLQQLGEQSDDSIRKSMFLVEAAWRGKEANERFPMLLEEAYNAAPDLPFSFALASRTARLKGDNDTLLAWIRRRREIQEDEVEQAFDELREALLLADSEPELALQLMEHASGIRPNDVALRELLERTGKGSSTDGAAWKAYRAEQAEVGERGRLALETAWEYELVRDYETAARFAALAAEHGIGELADVVQDRCEVLSKQGGRVSEKLIAQVKEIEDPILVRDYYMRMAEVDLIGRNDLSAALLWHRSILETDPTWLPSLRLLEQELIAEGREEELEPIFSEIAKVTQGLEAAAHAQVAVRLRLRLSPWDETADLSKLVASQEQPNLWSMRELFAHSSGKDPEAFIRAAQALVTHTDRPMEKAILLARATDAALVLDNKELAAELVGEALEHAPHHLPALVRKAALLEVMESFAEAARLYEKAAESACVPSTQAELYYRAALLWNDKVGDKSRACVALEAVSERDINFGDVFERLQAIFIEQGERNKLAPLLERRLEQVTDPAQRVELEVSRGRALAEIGDNFGAKEALASALEYNPDHVEALQAYAELCTEQEDWEGAEQALIRLERLTPDPVNQAAIFQRLGEIYIEHLPNPERARLAFGEVVKRIPDSSEALECLVRIHSVQGEVEQAIEVQNQLISRAKDKDEKRLRSIQLAKIYSNVANDLKKAEQTLEALRREAPYDARVLRALAEFHTRNGNSAALNTLLDRASTDARRALSTGRFDINFFANLTTVFEMRSEAEAAKVCKSTLLALQGKAAQLQGVGLLAASPEIDDLLAPDIFTPAFRTLLQFGGRALEEASSMDLNSLRATNMPDAGKPVAELAEAMGSAFGFPNLQVLVSPAIGQVCFPVSCDPPLLVFGAALVAEPNDAIRYYLLVRALKVLQAKVHPFAHTPPIELWPLTAAFLKCFVPNWNPQGVDMHKVSDYQKKMLPLLSNGVPPQAAQLAMEVTSSIGNKASTLQTTANAWGARCALLATGNVTNALESLAGTSGRPEKLPTDQTQRLKWIARHGEARDLIVFSVSDPYIEARSRCQ
jgi:cellulose synthase operon protein C